MHKNECTRLDVNRDFDALWYWLDELSLRLIKIYMSMKFIIESLRIFMLVLKSWLLVNRFPTAGIEEGYPLLNKHRNLSSYFKVSKTDKKIIARHQIFHERSAYLFSIISLGMQHSITRVKLYEDRIYHIRLSNLQLEYFAKFILPRRNISPCRDCLIILDNNKVYTRRALFNIRNSQHG